MDLSVAFLGTGGAVPSARRSTASVLVARGGERLLFDCGEGTQRQMQRSLGLVQLDEIYLTHFHADHFLGLPGLLKTYDLTDREQPLTIYGPRGLEDLFRTLGRLVGRLGFALDLVEIEPGDSDRRRGRRDPAFPGRAQRSRLRLRAGRGRAARPLRPRGGEAARGRRRPRLRRPPGWRDGDRAPTGRSRPADVMGEPRPGRTVVITGDTGPCSATVEAARGAELLVHDASFSEEEAQRAADTGHSTVGQAAAVAREAEVKMLALVHISSRYHVGKVLEEAREVYEPTVAPRDFDLIEIPFPERASPALVPNGARERDRPEGAEEELRRLARRSPRRSRPAGPPGGNAWRGAASPPRRSRARIDRQPPALAEHPVLAAPDDLGRIGPRRRALEEEALLLLGQLEAPHDLEEGAAAVDAPQQLRNGRRPRPAGRRRGRRSRSGSRSGERRVAACPQPELADAADRERMHRPGPVEARDVDQGVERGQREHPARGCGSPTRSRPGRRCRGRRGGSARSRARRSPLRSSAPSPLQV